MPSGNQLSEERNYLIKLYQEQSFLKFYLKNLLFLKIPVLIIITLAFYNKNPKVCIAIPIILVIFILVHVSNKRSLKQKIYDVEVEMEALRSKNRERYVYNKKGSDHLK